MDLKDEGCNWVCEKDKKGLRCKQETFFRGVIIISWCYVCMCGDRGREIVEKSESKPWMFLSLYHLFHAPFISQWQNRIMNISGLEWEKERESEAETKKKVWRNQMRSRGREIWVRSEQKKQALSVLGAVMIPPPRWARPPVQSSDDIKPNTHSCLISSEHITHQPFNSIYTKSHIILFVSSCCRDEL